MRNHVIALLFVMLLLPVLAQAQTTPIVIGNVLDAVSTEVALQRPGTREGNPILGQSVGKRLAIKSVGTLAQAWVVRKIGQRHPTAAKWLGYGIGAGLSAVAARNYSIARSK